MRVLLGLSALAALSAAGASVPAPLNGIWQIRSVSGVTLPQDATLVIAGGAAQGRLGCGRFRGTLQADGRVLRLAVQPLPPQPTERCLYALPGEIHRRLNTVTRFIVSQDTQWLVLFSKTGLVTLTRLGYVTPAGK